MTKIISFILYIAIRLLSIKSKAGLYVLLKVFKITYLCLTDVIIGSILYISIGLPLGKVECRAVYFIEGSLTWLSGLFYHIVTTIGRPIFYVLLGHFSIMPNTGRYIILKDHKIAILYLIDIDYQLYSVYSYQPAFDNVKRWAVCFIKSS